MFRQLWTALVCGLVAPIAPFALGHQLWIEAPGRTAPQSNVPIVICFGHLGEQTPLAMLQSSVSKLSAVLHLPGKKTSPIDCLVAEKGFMAEVKVSDIGVYQIDAKLEVGILRRAVHDMRPGTRLIMLAKAVIQSGDDWETPPAIGHPIEIIPMSDITQPAPGDALRLKVLRDGQPVGGPQVLVTLATTGPESPNDSALTEHTWTIEGHPDPSGEIAFPLVAHGWHVASISYFDDKPGVYQGPLSFDGDFSHLKPGDSFQGTQYFVTLAFRVE